MASFRHVVESLRDRYLPYHEGNRLWCEEKSDYNLNLPPWLCQPYVRDSPQEHIEKVEAKKIEMEKVSVRKKYEDEEGNQISRKRFKRLRRIALRPYRPTPPVKRGSNLCKDCPNPLGFKCDYKLCRQCCRTKCCTENVNCVGHKNLARKRKHVDV